MSPPANPALQRAEQDTLREILTWTQEVIEGRGSSGAQMVVTLVIGCLPYVGQAVDVYNILRNLYALANEPASPQKWMDLVLSLIALVPLVGDALKNIVMMMRQGKPLGRILDTLPNSLRGNNDAWFRQIDWQKYGNEISRSFSNLSRELIAALDNWAMKGLLGRTGTERLIRQLRVLEQQATRQIRQVVTELQRLHQRTLAMPLPSTTANTVRSTAAAPRRAPPGSSASGNVRITTSGTPTPANGQIQASRRQSERSNLGRQMTGVSGEHIADYYFVRRQHSRRKVNQHGQLYEMQQPGHRGIDHVWHSPRLPRGYRISDTKATAGATHRLETAQQVFQALQYGIDAYLGEGDEGRLRSALGNTRRDGRQMSHRWIAAKIGSAKLTPDAERELPPKVRAWERNNFKLGAQTQRTPRGTLRSPVYCPYDRSVITVVGANLNRHQHATGSDRGTCRKPVTSHQIATEFVIPVESLVE